MLHHSLLTKELAAPILKDLALLSVSQPVCFNVLHFPCLELAFFCLERVRLPAPCVRPSLWQQAVSSAWLSCQLLLCSLLLGPARLGEALQTCHVMRLLHGPFTGWCFHHVRCTSNHLLSSKVSFYAIFQNMTVYSSWYGSFYWGNGAGVPFILVTLCYLFKKRKKKLLK